MAPRKLRKAARDEFEVTAYTRERGQPQRKPLQRRADDLADGVLMACTHAEEPSWEKKYTSPPPEDRAG